MYYSFKFLFKRRISLIYARSLSNSVMKSKICLKNFQRQLRREIKYLTIKIVCNITQFNFLLNVLIDLVIDSLQRYKSSHMQENASKIQTAIMKDNSTMFLYNFKNPLEKWITFVPLHFSKFRLPLSHGVDWLVLVLG